MICKCVQALMDLYLQGRLASFQSRWMKDHIARCPKCRAEFKAWQKVFSGLRAVPALPAPEELKAALKACLHSEPRPAPAPLQLDLSALVPGPSMAWAFGLAAFFLSMSLSVFGPGIPSQACSDSSLSVCVPSKEKP